MPALLAAPARPLVDGSGGPPSPEPLAPEGEGGVLLMTKIPCGKYDGKRVGGPDGGTACIARRVKCGPSRWRPADGEQLREASHFGRRCLEAPGQLILKAGAKPA